MFLFAVMDWATRRVLAWRVSNSLMADFCVEAVEEAIAKFGKPEIFNTDQGSLLPRIFEMFVQVDAGALHAEGGRGIGLAVVRDLVEMHGGTVTVNSAGLGLGSEFTVLLPWKGRP